MRHVNFVAVAHVLLFQSTASSGSPAGLAAAGCAATTLAAVARSRRRNTNRVESTGGDDDRIVFGGAGASTPPSFAERMRRRLTKQQPPGTTSSAYNRQEWVPDEVYEDGWGSCSFRVVTAASLPPPFFGTGPRSLRPPNEAPPGGRGLGSLLSRHFPSTHAQGGAEGRVVRVEVRLAGFGTTATTRAAVDALSRRLSRPPGGGADLGPFVVLMDMVDSSACSPRTIPVVAGFAKRFGYPPPSPPPPPPRALFEFLLLQSQFPG